jgi:hypothetical protein
MPPVTTGTGQLYVVPAGTIPLVRFTGLTVKSTPLQMETVISVIAGFGLTVTVTVNVAPGQLPEVGVTVYVAVCAVFVGLISVPVILAPAPATPPVRPPVTTGAVHVYAVPAGTMPLVTLTGVAVKAVALQVMAVMAVIAGLGLTVTVTENVDPGHAPEVGVTV